MSRWALILCFLLGAWSSATVFMWQTAIRNFAVAADVISSDDEGLRTIVGDLPDENLRSVLRYQASEVNRLFFRGWGWVQLPLAVAVCGLAWARPGGRVVRWASGIMFVIVVILGVYVVPETVRLGRVMDFLAEGELPEIESAFWRLHHAYTGLDMVKFGLGLLAFGRVCFRPAP